MAEFQQLHALSEPTYCRLKHSKNAALLAKLDDLQNIMAVLKSSQKQQDKIMSEAKLLQVMIYKRRQQLRSEKSLQLLRRVQACLKRASTFGRLFTLIDDVHKDLLSAVSEMEKSDAVYLPAQQTWSYLLYLQLQYLKLLDIICSYCITAFEHLSCQFATGMLIPQMVVFMGIVARIWLLSRSTAEKIQSCYSFVYSVRQHFDRTNSAWKEPVLPPRLQLSSCEDYGRDVQEMYSVASKVPANDSMEVAKTGSPGKLPKSTVLPLHEETEDIGELVALTRTNNLGSSDNRSNKRKKTGENDFIPHKKRKQMSDSSKQNDVAVVSSKSNFSFVPAEMPAAKKKKRQKEKFSDMEMKDKKNSYIDNGSVKSSAPQEGHDVENIPTHETSALAYNVQSNKQKKHKKKSIKATVDGSVVLQNTRDDVRAKKHKKKSIKATVDGSVVLQNTRDDVRAKKHKKKSIKATVDGSVVLQNTLDDVQSKKHKKKKIKAVSVKHDTADGGKGTVDSPKKTCPKAMAKVRHQTIDREDNLNTKDAVPQSHKPGKLKKSKLKKKKLREYVDTV